MKRLIIGISGASGIPLAIRLLNIVKDIPEIETHLVMTQGAKITFAQESSLSLSEVMALADVVYDNQHIGASIASGTFETEGMIILPCSMKTIAGIAHGISDSLLLRASDVCIKEQRKLILVARETPLSPIHLDNLSYLSKLANVMICPPMMTYYQQPETIADMEVHLIGKVLSYFHIEVEGFRRWS